MEIPILIRYRLSDELGDRVYELTTCVPEEVACSLIDNGEESEFFPFAERLVDAMAALCGYDCGAVLEILEVAHYA